MLQAYIKRARQSRRPVLRQKMPILRSGALFLTLEM
jgi:hypothetical protein